MNGSDTRRLVYLLTSGTPNHTGSSNFYNGLDIAGITGDADATETAINIGSGWDQGLAISADGSVNDDNICVGAEGCKVDGGIWWSGSALVINAATASQTVNIQNNESNIVIFDRPAAGASGEIVNIANNIPAMNGSDTVSIFEIDIVNANHTTGSNNLNAIYIDGITGDADATETAINIGSGWDNSIFVTGDAGNICDAATGNVILSLVSGGHARIVIGSVATQSLLIMNSSQTVFHRFMVTFPAAGSSGDLAELGSGEAINAMNGSDTIKGLDLDYGNADHTSTGNTLSMINVDGITGDADATEVLLRFGDGFDYFLDDEVNTALGTLTWTTNSDKSANTASGTLKVFINGTLYHIQLYADS
jgi:hypothetical protein